MIVEHLKRWTHGAVLSGQGNLDGASPQSVHQPLSKSDSKFAKLSVSEDMLGVFPRADCEGKDAVVFRSFVEDLQDLSAEATGLSGLRS